MAKLMHLPQITQLSKYQSWDALGGMKPRQSRQSQLLFCIVSGDGAGLGDGHSPGEIHTCPSEFCW